MAQYLLVHLLQERMYFRPIDGHGTKWLVRPIRMNHGGIGKPLRLGDEVDLSR
jgi:hypothetical protein